MTTTAKYPQRKTLVAGATGQIGSSVGMHLVALGDWNPVGLARKPDPQAPYPMLAVDLTDVVDCQHKLAGLNDITHLVYAARFDHFGGELESKDTNVAMLANLLDTLEPIAKNLQHIHLVHGTKYYGHTVRERRTPYREDDACGNFKSFYYEQQMLVQQRQRERNWSWSISRPHAFCNYRTDETRNMILVLGIYASLLRELGEPLHFPGTAHGFEVKTQFSWLPTLSRSVTWMMTEPQCANQAYNIVNADPLSWSELWSSFAQYFNMPVGKPNSSSFTEFAASAEKVWHTLIKKHGLRQSNLQTVVQWPYGDYVLSPQWDVVSDMHKAQRDGFMETVNTPKMFLGGFDFFREHGMIP